MTQCYRGILTIIICLSAVSVRAQQTHPLIDSLLDRTIQEYNIPALAASVIMPDTMYYGVKGTTKRNGTTPVTLGNRFHLGSNTKAFTAFIAMQLVEQGQIKLTTSFIELVPELKDSVNETFLNITLADLLSHQAGVQPYTLGIEYLKLPKLSGPVSDKRYQFSAFVLQEEPVEIGTYSNAGYVIAALMLEKASQQSFEALVESTMATIGISYSLGFPNKADTTQPWGHWQEKGTLKPLGPDHFYRLRDFALPAGDLSMTLPDYATFVQLNLQGLTGTGHYLSAENYQQLHFGKAEYSYGWGNSITKDNKVSYHDGSAGTYYCHTFILSRKKVAVVIFMNTADNTHVKGIYKLRDVLLKNSPKL